MSVNMGYHAKIAAELEHLKRPIGTFNRHPENVRVHDIPKIAGSLDRHGQRAPIVVQKSTGLIVKGNGTHEAAETLGWEEAAFLEQEMSDEEAIEFLYADNRASDKASYDRKRLKEGLEKLAAGPGLFGTLWEADELEDLIAEQDAVPETPPEKFTGGYADAGEEAEKRKAGAAEPGTKMKEVPVVLTAAEHVVFIANVRRLQKAYQSKGVIATIVEAVRREAAAADGAVSTADAEGIRQATLKTARDYFLTAGKPSFAMAEVAAFFQSAMRAPTPEPQPEPEVVPGQTTLDEMFATDQDPVI